MRQAEKVDRREAAVRFAAELRLFLAPRHRGGRVLVACDGTSSLGHVVESLGVPLPEVGVLSVNGQPATPGYRLAAGDDAGARAVRQPPRSPSVMSMITYAEQQLEPGTQHNFQAFSRCQECGLVYWRGAHSQRLQQVVGTALATVAASGSGAAVGLPGTGCPGRGRANILSTTSNKVISIAAQLHDHEDLFG